MGKASFSFNDYIEAEEGFTKQSLDAQTPEIKLCIDLWNFFEKGFLKSVDRQCILFMWFFQQAKISLHLAITSLMQLHTTQSNQNLRYALENIAICMYYLNCPKEVNEIFVEINPNNIEKVAEKIKNKAYKFLEDQYKILNDIIKRYKKNFNDYGAHSNFASAAMNAQVAKDKDKININFFDDISPFYLRIRFLIVADIMYGFCEAILKQRMDEKMLLLKENAEEEVKKFHKINLELQKKLNDDKNKAQRKIGRNEPCYCGSGFKFKKCHGR